MHSDLTSGLESLNTARLILTRAPAWQRQPLGKPVAGRTICKPRIRLTERLPCNTIRLCNHMVMHGRQAF